MSAQERKRQQDPLLAWVLGRCEEFRRRRAARKIEKSSGSGSIPSVIFISKMSSEKKQTSRRGIANYSWDERIYFMKLMEKIKPVGAEEWKKVEELHSKQFKNDRDFGSLRRKYNQLANKGCPTGIPNVPEDIKLARRVKHLISVKMNLGTGHEKYSLEDGYEEENIGPEDFGVDDEDDNPPPPADEIPLGQPSQLSQENTQETQETQTQIVDVDDTAAPSFLQPLAPPSFSAPAKSVYTTPSKRSYTARSTASSSIVSSVENILEVVALSFAKNEKYAEERRIREEKEDRDRKLKEEKEERQRRQDKEDAKEEREKLYGVIAALAQGVTTAWAQAAAGGAAVQPPAPPPRQRIARKRRRDDDE